MIIKPIAVVMFLVIGPSKATCLVTALVSVIGVELLRVILVASLLKEFLHLIFLSLLQLVEILSGLLLL